jgi:hypothetical protein
MNRQVNVWSIAALRRFQAALREYADAVEDVQTNLQMESQRTVDWIQQDRTAYWPRELRLAEETLNESLNQLELKQLTLDGRDAPSCSEERNAVHRARQRVRYAQERLARTRQLGPLVQHHAEEYRGVLAKLLHIAESEVPRAVAALDRMATALETYAAQATPSPQVATRQPEEKG